jgi:hypothetical protein
VSEVAETTTDMVQDELPSGSTQQHKYDANEDVDMDLVEGNSVQASMDMSAAGDSSMQDVNTPAQTDNAAME